MTPNSWFGEVYQLVAAMWWDASGGNCTPDTAVGMSLRSAFREATRGAEGRECMVDISQYAEILVVQDDPAEALLMREEFGDHHLANRVQVAHDVARAVAYLDGTPPFNRPAIPDLVLLDVNLPGRDGRVVLRHLRARPQTRAVPVILLTDSPEAERILQAEFLPVQGYATKPIDFARLVTVVKAIEELGFQVWRSPS
jgi:CheY-like chemotaxis protein